MKFRKKPLVVEAIKYEKEHIGKAQDFCDKIKYNPHNNEFYIETLEGCMEVKEGDYIVKGVNGEFYPYDVDTFVKTYDIDYVEPDDDNTYYVIEYDNGLEWEDHRNYSLGVLFKNIDNAKAYAEWKMQSKTGGKAEVTKGSENVAVYAESDRDADEPEYGFYTIERVILQD